MSNCYLGLTFFISEHNSDRMTEELPVALT